MLIYSLDASKVFPLDFLKRMLFYLCESSMFTLLQSGGFMSKPDISTPITIVLNVLRSLSAWFKAHKMVLRHELEDSYDGEKKSIQLADGLEQAQELFQNESGQDAMVTEKRHKQIQKMGVLYRSISSSVKRRAKEQGTSQRMLKDFQIGSPSRIRTVTKAQDFLRELNKAITLHEAALSKTKDRTSEWYKEIKEHRQAFEELAKEDTREDLETTSAKRKRDGLREESISFIDDMELAALAVGHIDALPYEELQIIFSSQNPKSPTKNNDTNTQTPETTTNTNPSNTAPSDEDKNKDK
ncbi:MAG: hypothetical protein CL920_10485 [Deltaproteobacteria bacterium]|nr:hypothetical protein [Deltaproteobacteria bacterium]